jgi:multiple sugar transport system permease protein
MARVVAGLRAKKIDSYAFLSPGLLGILAILAAIAYSIYMSFYNYKLGYGDPTFVGIANYQSLAQDPIFRAAVVNTFIFVLAAATAELSYGVLLAILLYWSRLRYLLLPLLALPIMLPAVNLVVIWRFLFHPDLGVVNDLLAAAGLPRINPLNDPRAALPTIILMDIWQLSPLVMVVVFASFSTIPREVVTAARVDGATGWAFAKNILLPMAKNVILAIYMLRLIDAFRIFAKVYLLTKGGPGVSTEVLELQIYTRGVRPLEIGLGSSMAVILLAMSMAVIIPYLIVMVRLWRR